LTISLTSNHWLITGGCGFIGSSLIATLLKEYPEVQITVLDNFSVGTRDDLHEAIAYFNKGGYHNFGNIELIEGNIKDYDTCCQCSEGVDVIVHLAANTGVAPSVENPRRDMEVNLIGTFNMLEAARQNNVKKFIFASSGAAIGEVEPPIDEEKVQKPVSPYGASKLAGEAYCSSYFRTFGINTVSLRFGNVYGPLSKHKSSVVAKFLRQAFSGETLEIYGDGSQTRDFIYIDDLIRAIILSVNSNLGGEVFQIATYKETTVSEIAKKIKNLIENDRGKKINIIHGVPRRGDVKRNYSDISKAKRMIGFSPRVRLDKGLESTFEYFRTKLRE
jgi:UDP-glucose 4-epimerase